MASIVINSITLDCTPGSQFDTDIEYRVSGGGSFTSAGSAVTNTDGTFVTPFVINGLAEDTCYDIRFSTTDFLDCPYTEMFCIGSGTTTTTTTTSTTTTTTLAPPMFNWTFAEFSGGVGSMGIDVNSINVVFATSNDGDSFSGSDGDFVEVVVSGVGSHTKTLVVTDSIDGVLYSAGSTSPQSFSFTAEAGHVYDIDGTVEIL